MAMLADYISTLPTDTNSTPHPQSREQAVADFLDVLPDLARGMHVNVRFCAPTAFEFTKEVAVFDLLPRVTLLHGWLVDPQDARLAAALDNLSYNQVVDELVRTATPGVADHAQDVDGKFVHTPSAPPLEEFDDRAADVHHPAVAESVHTAAIRELRPLVVDFLESNSTMLTVYGLTELHAAVNERDCAVLFRNSHFYVLRKWNGELFTLVTDVGYLNELNTVWEKLADVTGDSVFYDGQFRRIQDDGTTVENILGNEQPAQAQNGGSAVGAGGGYVPVASTVIGHNATTEQQPGPQQPAPRRSLFSRRRNWSHHEQWNRMAGDAGRRPVDCSVGCRKGVKGDKCNMQ